LRQMTPSVWPSRVLIQSTGSPSDEHRASQILDHISCHVATLSSTYQDHDAVPPMRSAEIYWHAISLAETPGDLSGILGEVR
jgi:hypothetical protein